MGDDPQLLHLVDVAVLHHRGPEPAVVDFNLSLGAGESIVVTGDEGSGKTSLIYGLLGLAQTTGEVRVLGTAPGSPHTRPRIGFAPQGRPYPPGSTCGEIVGLVGAVRGAQGDGPMNEALSRAGLADDVETEVDDLDVEQNRRLALACALVGDPDLLLIDDAWASPETLAAVESARAAGGGALLTSAHDDLDERFGRRLALPVATDE
mgnify:CR=1 FL=1